MTDLATASMTHDRKTILVALNGVMKDVEQIEKGGVNAFHQYAYTKEEDVLSVLHPILAKHGLIIFPSARAIDFKGPLCIVTMDYQIGHVSGAMWPETLTFFGTGIDKGDKALYKAYTGANKYFWLKLLQLASTEDPENERREGEKIDTRPVRRGQPMPEPEPIPPTEVDGTDWATVARDYIAAISRAASMREIGQMTQDHAAYFKQMRDAAPESYDQCRSAHGARVKQLDG